MNVNGVFLYLDDHVYISLTPSAMRLWRRPVRVHVLHQSGVLVEEVSRRPCHEFVNSVISHDKRNVCDIG
jgi:hypothetical protein